MNKQTKTKSYAGPWTVPYRFHRLRPNVQHLLLITWVCWATNKSVFWMTLVAFSGCLERIWLGLVAPSCPLQELLGSQFWAAGVPSPEKLLSRDQLFPRHAKAFPMRRGLVSCSCVEPSQRSVAVLCRVHRTVPVRCSYCCWCLCPWIPACPGYPCHSGGIEVMNRIIPEEINKTWSQVKVFTLVSLLQS